LPDLPYRSLEPLRWKRAFLRFVRVGTLDNPDTMPPDVHIFTASKQPWFTLPPDARVFPEYYRREELWSAEAKERYSALLPAINAWKAGQ
jgi:hypothetical protein